MWEGVQATYHQTVNIEGSEGIIFFSFNFEVSRLKERNRVFPPTKRKNLTASLLSFVPGRFTPSLHIGFRLAPGETITNSTTQEKKTCAAKKSKRSIGVGPLVTGENVSGRA